MKYLGIDIGGTKCAVSIGEEINGQLVIKGKRIIPTQHNISAYEMIDKMCVAAEEMTDDFSKMQIVCDAGSAFSLLHGWRWFPPAFCLLHLALLI